jgi:hypothetical protein
MINTQRTTDYHEHLREYDLPNTTEWHTISMTTHNLEVVPGDTVYVQLCATDYGPDKYQVDVDYYRADVVRRDSVKADLGEPLLYHPPIPELTTFSHHLNASHDSLINSDFPDVNFDDWHIEGENGITRILTIDSNQWAILRWDLEAFSDRKANGAGVLELTTYSVPMGGKYVKHFGEDLGVEFGKIRVIEILDGDPVWDQETVTYNSLLRGKSYSDVFNTQMISDIEVSSKPGSKSYVTLSRPVMQRLLEGKTKGLLIRPLGSLAPSIYSSESGEATAPKLHFSIGKKS